MIVATQWAGGATENALHLAGLDHFNGKPVLDVTNPLDFSSGAPRLSIGHTDSAGESVQRWLPKAHVVKVFNSVSASVMVNPSATGDTPDMMIAGNEAAAKQQVTQILHDFGWTSIIDLGGIEASRYLEALCMIWVIYWQQHNTSTHAFKLVGR
ncbi:MAG: hypothetical protein HC794_03120 [Nitrospiraceae bacterium]|nr:hypothetical protein [Nitrospiraceae bacterium]